MGPITIIETDVRAPLRAESLHVWRITLDRTSDVLERLLEWLSADERARAERFRFEPHRDHFVAGRGVLRAVMGHYLGLRPDRVAFDYGPQGKPSLANGCSTVPLEFNLTHSHGLALLAVALGRRVGIDVEQVRPMDDAERIAERFFSPAERTALRAVPPGDKIEAFFRCWTRKEAFIKAIGEGFSMPLDCFDVSLEPGLGARLLAVADRPGEAARWSLTELEPAPGFLAAVAMEGACEELRLYEATTSHIL
jgi:4'-phosphopantetheinyl transferase